MLKDVGKIISLKKEIIFMNKNDIWNKKMLFSLLVSGLIKRCVR